MAHYIPLDYSSRVWVDHCPKWIVDAVARNIRHFAINSLFAGLSSIHGLKDCMLVTSDTSLSKKIAWTDQLSMVLLPNLKKLHLVSSNYELLEELISRCPSLEDLFLTLNHDPQNILISITSKKLKRLYINLQRVSSFILLDAPILEHFRYVVGSILSMQMLDSILNVKSLALRAENYRPLKFYNSPKKTIFPNLSHLTLSLPFGVYQKIFDEQLLCCPNLKVLKLHLSGPTNMILNDDVKFELVEQVKCLEVYMTYGEFSKQLLNLLTWLIKSAKVLEKLLLSSHHLRPDYKEFKNLAKSQVYETLFECVESISRCQIEFLGDYKLD
ncbi:F-box/FBD/LRR-repeat protein At1g13780-like [Silene latifolia]|uniref:F-box/FBD/LRR-repeat protein At1g13780-like n=1 Tax=Silene latifolia TaxID=37657 RepID=UPI003D7736CB